jgi:hypothetical protein
VGLNDSRVGAAGTSVAAPAGTPEL